MMFLAHLSLLFDPRFELFIIQNFSNILHNKVTSVSQKRVQVLHNFFFNKLPWYDILIFQYCIQDLAVNKTYGCNAAVALKPIPFQSVTNASTSAYCFCKNKGNVSDLYTGRFFLQQSCTFVQWLLTMNWLL